VTTRIADELFRLFPEIAAHSSEGDEHLPYVMMANLVALLGSMPSPLSEDVVKRLMELNYWCAAQPRGSDASDDALTILVVGLFEKIVGSETLYYLAPKLISKSDMIASKDYLVQWVGQEDYDRAMALFS
jgi:hypothetical protein